MSFISIRLSSIRPGLSVPFKVFLKLGDQFIQYLHPGDDFDQNRLLKLKEKGLKKFYIDDVDELQYQRFLEQILEQVKLAADDVKTSFALDVTENSAGMTLHKAGEEKSYIMAKSSSEIVQKLLLDNKNVLREMVNQGRSFNTSDANRIQTHLVNTASIAIKFAEFLKSSVDINSLGVAAFYHDVSYSQFNETDQKLFFKEMSQMTAEELTRYKEHPLLSAQTLQDKAFADKTIMELILTHEERISGTGFPNKLTRLTQAQEILALSAFYDREITCLGKDANMVRESLMVDQLGNFNLETLKQFKSFIKNFL